MLTIWKFCIPGSFSAPASLYPLFVRETLTHNNSNYVFNAIFDVFEQCVWKVFGSNIFQSGGKLN